MHEINSRLLRKLLELSRDVKAVILFSCVAHMSLYSDILRFGIFRAVAGFRYFGFIYAVFIIFISAHQKLRDQISAHYIKERRLCQKHKKAPKSIL